MFEDQQGAVEELLATDEKFKGLYEQHRQLKERVHEISIGIKPVDSVSLERMKKEKLLLKDKMAFILKTHLAAKTG